MAFQNDPFLIQWRLHLKSPPAAVYALINSSEGRARFWAESAIEEDDHINFHFPSGITWRGQILKRSAASLFSLNYFGSETSFTLEEDGAGGTELTLVDKGVSEEHRAEVAAGWVSVLMALKAAVDFGGDLRNHDPKRSWDQGYCNN